MLESLGKSLTGWRFVGGVVVGAVSATAGAYVLRVPPEPIVEMVPLECHEPPAIRVWSMPLPNSALLWRPNDPAATFKSDAFFGR